MTKLKTIDLKGKSYATVPERVRQFREDNPNGSIETNYTKHDDGTVTFKSFIIMDQSDSTSKKATGHSDGKIDKEKSFEKLETIAVGRALAFLGYLASGEIASFEEMEDFYKYKEERKQEAIETLKACKTVDDLKKVWSKLGSLMADKEIIETKDEVKALCK